MASSFFKTDDYIYKPKGGFTGDFGSSNYKYSSGDSGNKWKQAFDLASGFLKGRSSDDDNKYRDWGGAAFGDSRSGGAFNLSPELNVVYSQQQPPVYFSGTPGKKGFGETIGGLVGTIGGALVGGPAGAAIGGSLGSGAGSFFG
jgi:hypothetical protein